MLLGLLPTLVLAQQLSLRYHTAADGLGNLGVNALAQEPGGALWIGTESGLYRDDGETIHREDGGPKQIIYSMVFGVDGALWVASQAGLYRRNGSGATVVVPANDGAWKLRWGQTLAALPDGGVLVIGVDGMLWRVTANGEDARREPALPATLVPPEPHALDARSILVARDGAWWFGCGSALCRWRENRLERWTEADGVPRGDWRGLLEAKDGSIWARSDHHVVRRTADATHFSNVTPEGLSRGAAHGWLPLREDREGRVLTTGDGGVFRWQAGRWQHFGKSNGLEEERIHALLQDRDGDVWLGTSGHGLVQWRGYGSWSSWTRRQGLPSDEVWSIADDGTGRVWIGTDRSVASMERGTTKVVIDASAVTGQVVGMVADGSGGMWLQSLGGKLFHRTRAAPWRMLTGRYQLRPGKLLAANGELWVTTGSGLFSTPLDGSGSLRRRDELDRLVVADGDRYIITACREADSGVIWVGTGGTLLRFDPAKGFARQQVDGLAPNGGVVYLACGAGRVWLRTAIGQQLMRIDLARPGALRAVPVQPAVLNGRHILSLLEDHRGWLWVGTDAGVVMWNGKDWRRFDESNGLVWNDCDQDALAEDAWGSIWVGTSRGVSRIDDPAQLGASVPLTLKLTEAKLGNVDLVPGRKVDIPWSTQPLELHWEVPLFTNRLAQHTRYRLRGRDDDWADITRSDLRYAGLGAGSYSLELVAVNDDQGQSSQPLALDFEIAPRWWQSLPVIAAALTLLLLLGYAGYRVRIRRLVRRQIELVEQVQERKRMAQRQEESQQLLRQLAARNEDAREDERRSLKREIHDELGQYLLALRLGISIVDLQLEENHSPLQEKTQRLIAVVDTTIKVVRNVVVALRPSALDLGIESALEWLVRQYSESTGIQCELQVPEGDLDMDDKRATAVFRIVQESLTNVARHAQATQVKISLEQKEDHYLLEVQDNGQGFDPSIRKEKSFGLVSIRERALMLRGEVEISSVPGRTEIRVHFPVHAGVVE